MQWRAFSRGESRSLHLRFIVKHQDELVAIDFIGLFECIDIFTRTIFESEALLFLTDAGFPDEWKLSTLQRIHKLGRKAPVPAEIVDVRKGSWEIETILTSAALIWFLRNYAHPVVQDAWNESKLREKIVTFLRDKIFLGAKKSIERKAIEKPNYRGLIITEIMGPEIIVEEEAEIIIILRKGIITEPHMTDHELLDDFIQRIKQ